MVPVTLQAVQKSLKIDRLRAAQHVKTDQLQHVLDSMHKQVAEKITNTHMQPIRAHNRRTNIIHLNFNVGDFIVVRHPRKAGHKLQLFWLRPRRINVVKNPLVYKVSRLNSSDVEIVHSECS